MPSRSTVVSGIVYALVGVGFAATFLPHSSTLRGWVVPATLAASGVVFAGGLTTMPRRSSVAFGAYLLVVSLEFSLSRFWTARPAWWGEAATYAIAAAVIGFVIATWLDRTAPRAAH
jgi:hypothetical protein